VGVVAAAVLGLVLAAALWWAYFARDAERSEANLSAASMNDRVRMALFGYFYTLIPMLVGVITLAAGVELTIGNLGSRSSSVWSSRW